MNTDDEPKTAKIPVTKGSTNVFEDLGFEDAAELLPKAELTRQICNAVRARALTHRAAAGVLGVAHPDVTALMNGRTTSFSLDRLMKLLMRLDNDVEIVVKPRPQSRKESQLTVKATHSNVLEKFTHPQYFEGRKIKDVLNMAKHNEYFVEPRGGEWVVRLPHAERASAVEGTQTAAIAKARRFAPEGVVHVKQRNGKFRKV